MLPYARIASLLEDIDGAQRSDKAILAAGLLADLRADMICPGVRLLTGELWPAWEELEMGMGPRAIVNALAEISTEDVESLYLSQSDLGLVAEAALLHRSQNAISIEPLDAMHVYESLYHISRQKGLDSEHRREAILRGLFLKGEPLMAKYIARTVMNGTLVGLGPQTMILAISMAFGAKPEEITKAYALLPDLGMVAEAASKGALADIGILASRPVKPMLIRSGEIRDPAGPRGYLPASPGLRVQVHKVGHEFFVYTMRQKSIASALMSLSMDLLAIGHDFIVDATLVVFQKSKIQSLTDVVRFINRRHLSRKNLAIPALVASDLIWLDGRDLTGLKYADRRERLKAVIGGPKELPFRGISLAEQRVLEDRMAIEDYYAISRQKGMRGLFSRELNAPYLPGRYSKDDYSIKAVDNGA